jgi:hypothetical protein
MRYSFLLFLAVITFLFSCKSDEEKRNEKTLMAIKSHMSDVCFKRNLSLEILDVKINKTEAYTVDSAYKIILKSAYYQAITTLEKTNPDKKDDMNWISYTANNNPTKIKFEKLRKDYNGWENWYWVYAYVKATQTDRQGIKDNFILDNAWFIIDENCNILDSGFKYE